MNKRMLRITIGIVFLVFLIVSFVPSCYQSTSGDGLINARTVTLRSPIEGVLHFSKPTKCGALFAKDEIIGKVVNDRINKSFLHELMTEKRTLESRMAIMDERQAEFTRLGQHLNENLEKYQKFSARQLDEQIRQNDERLTQEQAEYDRAKKEHDANRQLLDRQALKQREFDSSEANYFKSAAKIRELTNRQVELKNTLEAVNTGVFLGDGHNDVPYSSQRRDQLVIETSLAKAAKTEAQDRLVGIDQQIAAERERLEKMETFTLSAPFNSIVWRVTETQGSAIVIDTPLIVLLDCSSVFLDITLSESQFSDIAGGDTIRYRLIGKSEYHKGKIFALRGSGSDVSDLNLAASLTKDPKREFHVWVSITPEDLDLKPENFYKVGHRVEVKIPRHWNIWQEIVRFFNVF